MFSIGDQGLPFAGFPALSVSKGTGTSQDGILVAVGELGARAASMLNGFEGVIGPACRFGTALVNADHLDRVVSELVKMPDSR